MIEYKRITESIIHELEKIVGPNNVIHDDEKMETYSHDEAPSSLPFMPEVVVKPRNSIEVSKILTLANKEYLPVTPRGAGTGVSGGAVPIYSGLVLSLELMNSIKEIDEDNFVAVIEPGVTLMELCQTVELHGLYYPVYPGEKSAQLGGNVATNAGGMRAVRYGVTRNFVLGLEVVLATGEIIRTGGKFVKCSTGYDLTQLITGSEGTLALITEITLRLSTQPQLREVLFIPFPSLSTAIRSVPQILKQGIPIMGLEFLEKDAVKIIEDYIERKLPFSEHPAFLLGIIEGNSSEEVFEHANRIAEVCTRNGAIDIYIPTSERAKRELLDAREKLFPAIKRAGPIEVLDVVVPRSRIADFVAIVKEVSVQYDIPIIAPGHAGDGNVHLHLMGRNIGAEKWEESVPRIMEELYRAGVALGGTISGEHGLGYEKKKYLGIAMDPEKIALMKRLKKAFDPNGILNPGKIFDID
ncbi:MAG: FAD-binding protein [Chloroflexi bacterium]|nr:FAD-binding protein [Chloroflexota bacterium]